MTLIKDLAEVQVDDKVTWTVDGTDFQFMTPAYASPDMPGWLLVAGVVLRRPDGLPARVVKFVSAWREDNVCICNPTHRVDDPICQYKET